ncbi:GNAT family N-acetyltransferase [Glaciihabitans sp. GrIS 2.15]|uniref:GNAT family N-acetyltransferase n=1 Tax=Glaciihabitans sp. GrIS 2.15 TaxID=3071710 RepID=UPI002E13D668
MSDEPVMLRPITGEDLSVLFPLAADLATWEERSPASPGTMSRAKFDEKQSASDLESSEGAVKFAIDVDGVVVGSVSLFDFDNLSRHAEVGIALVSDSRGRGIGTSAISQIVEFGFVRRNLRRIHLQAIESNAAAIRAYEKAGFIIEGHQREHAWVRGHYEDIVVMGILRSEWSDRKDSKVS